MSPKRRRAHPCVGADIGGLVVEEHGVLECHATWQQVCDVAALPVLESHFGLHRGFPFKPWPTGMTQQTRGKLHLDSREPSHDVLRNCTNINYNSKDVIFVAFKDLATTSSTLCASRSNQSGDLPEQYTISYICSHWARTFIASLKGIRIGDKLVFTDLVGVPGALPLPKCQP